MEKVKEPNIDYEVKDCPRCNQSFCPNCITFEEVDFVVFDNDIKWKGTDVCPWCYNQLIDLKAKKEVSSHSSPK
ncbi:hypothetical protein LCGC14_2317630 [marine sediment metagenome]|uniref:Uncharacterized protein n=1 Tax=marine sediment metagenome TaxID=412755 RepID=A0A0F9FDK3_9ZZZZ